MIKAPLPENEIERNASVKRMQLLFTPQEESFDRITRTLQRALNVPVCFISVVADDYKWLKSKVGLGSEADKGSREMSICGHIVSGGVPIVINDTSKDPRFFDNDVLCNKMNIRFYMGRPLRNSEGYVVGTLCAFDHTPRAIDPSDYEILDAFGHWVELVFAARGFSQAIDSLLSDLDEARRESMMDFMLSIWNRGAISDILLRETDYAQRLKSPVTLLMADVDSFKSVNDFYGHGVGDDVLIEITKALRSQLRSYDSLGRYGGEEFLIVLPNTNQQDGIKLAHRLREAVESLVLKVDGAALRCTISIGLSLADFKNASPTIDKVLKAADMALLQAKQNGRNRVELGEAPS